MTHREVDAYEVGVVLVDLVQTPLSWLNGDSRETLELLPNHLA